MKRWRVLQVAALSLAAVLALAGCGAGTKQDIMNKTENVKTKAELEKALGKPDKFTSQDLPLLGKSETWTYKGSDGEVIFQLQNDKVIMRLAGESKK